MTVNIQKVAYGQVGVRNGPGIMLYLTTNTWDDYGYKTLFTLVIEDLNGQQYHIGDVKIGYANQAPDSSTRIVIQDGSPSLDQAFFSVGQDADYYTKLTNLPEQLRRDVLIALRDIVHDSAAMQIALSEAGSKVFHTSLLRGLALTTVQEQFVRILGGGVLLTPFHFGFQLEQTDDQAGISLEFKVQPGSKPSTNIHVLIGRNGIGKTTLLNNMISCLVDEHVSNAKVGNFYDLAKPNHPVDNHYFTSIISTSFSAFDPFTPPPDRTAESDAIRYTYIGLKEVQVDLAGKRTAQHKDIHGFADDFLRSFVSCMVLERKRERWKEAIDCLSSDSNFAEMQLDRLPLIDNPSERELRARQFFAKMSSGHAVVLLTLTKLVERTEEKTLVLMDEPESHLHPPLLSAFVRALSQLLNNRNGVAIIATHSPVILQEVSMKCVWKLRRTRLELSADRPDEETFGENSGTLTRDVFGLEVKQSGFYDILNKEVESGKSFDQIVLEYGDQIGFEGKALVRALIRNREG